MKKSLLAAALALSFSAHSFFAQDLIIPPGKDPRFNWASYDALKSEHLQGKKITVFGPWTGDEKTKFENVIAYFEAATGADVVYDGSDSFEQQIVIDTQGGSAPNVSIFPQPGLAADLAAKGYLTPLSEKAKERVIKDYAAGKSWVKLATFKGPHHKDHFYGVFYRVDLKSLVWYSPDNFADAGYQVPKTMEQLKALTKKIVADGGTPWCIGLGSGAATGWPATDWVEDLLLRMQPPSVYDGWITNKVKFNDPRIIAAIKEFGWFARNNKFVYGGTSAVGTTDFRDSPKGLFTSPPECYMVKQASFVTAFFPKDVKVGVDADFFYFPPFASKKDLGRPVEGAGTLATITNNSKGAHDFVNFLGSPIAQEIWMAQGGFLSADLKANPAVYSNNTERREGKILLDATTFRFDASDMMPGRIGAGAFWTGMVNYVNGESAKNVANDIQKTWDALKKN